MPRRKTAYAVISDWVDEQISRARLKSDNGAVRELLWLKDEVLSSLLSEASSNQLFFRVLAQRKDVGGLLRWFLCLIEDSDEREQVKAAARRVYGAGRPPFQPKLLEILNGSAT